jgi:hypothetical protein
MVVHFASHQSCEMMLLEDLVLMENLNFFNRFGNLWPKLVDNTVQFSQSEDLELRSGLLQQGNNSRS